MKAVEVRRPGGPETLELVEKPTPSPDSDSLLIELRAIGVNFADILCREASHPGMPRPPLIPGCEGAGVVVACGDRIQRFQKGDRVAVYSPPGGSYAEFMTSPEDYCLALPETMNFEQGAAFCHVFLTAYHALLTMGRARPGERVLITAAAGGVGTALVQLARLLELEVVAAVGSDEKRQLVRQLGAQQAVSYQRPLDPSEVAGRVELICESVGGDVFDWAMEWLAPLGRVILFGFASGDVPLIHPRKMLPRSGTLSALNLSVIFDRRPELVRSSWSELRQWFQSGRIRPIIHHRYPLSDAARAHERMQNRRSTGKILLLPGES